MTADIRTAAREQSKSAIIRDPAMRYTLEGIVPSIEREESAFVAGAVWGAARVTPTREQIERALIGRDFIAGTNAVLALIAGLAEGEMQ